MLFLHFKVHGSFDTNQITVSRYNLIVETVKQLFPNNNNNSEISDALVSIFMMT